MRPQLLRAVLCKAIPIAEPAADVDLLRRFVTERDDAAFAELVRRYARLVWGVCRNLLADEADAEDAFQATFLVLLRSAGRIRNARALGGWLHGTAYRVCQKAKRSAARRRKRERSAAVGEASAPVADSTWEVLVAAVHEEVCRLPESQRVPFVLCCLEGKGVTEAAAELGWKLGTLSGRLTRAKQELLARLARRGIASGVAAVAAVTGGTTTAAPRPLIDVTLGLARSGAAVPDSIIQLTLGGSTMTRTKLLAAGILLTTAVGISTWSAHVPTADAQAPSRNTPDRGGGGPRGAGAGPDGRPARADGTYAGPKWEYRFVHFGDDAWEQKANDLGNEGWEMVANTGGQNFFFKRQKSPGRTRTGYANMFSSGAGGGDEDGAKTELIPLRHAVAHSITQTLQPLFMNRLTFTSDAASNTLIVKGSAEVVAEVKKLVEKLESLADEANQKALQNGKKP
jgi:RNA polymerase sigma factor (sigma-70 family)